MRKRKKVGSQAGAKGILVSDIDPLARKCRDTLRNVMNQKSIGFDKIPLPGSRDEIVFTGGSFWASPDNQYRYPVILLRNTTTQTYWVCVSILFERETPNIFLSHISIRVLTGDPINENKSLRFRAEWDARTNPVGNKHAQPHWHIHFPSMMWKTDSNNHDDFRTWLDQMRGNGFVELIEKTTEETVLAYWPKSSDIHFAMSARWHDSSNHSVALEETHIAQWLSGCITYIRGQLEE